MYLARSQRDHDYKFSLISAVAQSGPGLWSLRCPWLFAFKGYHHNSVLYRINTRPISGHLEFISVSKKKKQKTRLCILNSYLLMCLETDFSTIPLFQVTPVKNWAAENCQIILFCPLQRKMTELASFEPVVDRHID